VRISYYPGCSLEGLASDYNQSIEAVFQHLGIDLVEIDDWTCCGSTAAHSLDHMMAVALPARNLAAAEAMGLDIVSPCALCFNRLRFSQEMIRKKLFDMPWSCTGKLQVHDMTRFLAEPNMLAAIRKRVVRPLKSLRVVCYYGCQMVRPPKITGFHDYENPMTLDNIVAAAGAQVIDWSFKSTCCGASIKVARKDIGESLTRRILQKAKQTGAEAIVVSCPLCQSNLDMIARDPSTGDAPVFYFTELLRLAFEESQRTNWLESHITDPVPVLTRRGLWDT
jgi:heterodisulfide reductase subunit B